MPGGSNDLFSDFNRMRRHLHVVPDDTDVVPADINRMPVRRDVVPGAGDRLPVGNELHHLPRLADVLPAGATWL